MKTEIFGVKFDNFTVEESVKKAVENLNTKRDFFIVTPNPEIVELARKNKEYRDVLNSADIVTPDGIGIVYASKILKGHVKTRAPGFDIVCGIVEELSKINGTVYLFGGKPGVADTAAKKLTEKYPGINIVGTHHGYFDNDEEIVKDMALTSIEVAKQANISMDEVASVGIASPDLLLVCLGAPKQEFWISRNIKSLNCGILIGAGGSIDVLSGNVKRAPEVFIKLGLEWFYRLLKEPKRTFEN